MHHDLGRPGLQRRRIAGASLLLLAGCGGGNTEREEDPVVPTLVITSDAPGDATGPFTVRFTFSAAVSSFSSTRVVLTNGALNGAVLVKLSDTVYTLRVTPSANRQDVLTVQVPAGAYRDATGEVANAVAYNFNQRIDTIVATNEPVLTIGHDAAGAVATGPVTFNFEFSVDVGTSFAVEDIRLDTGTLGNFTRVSGTRCTVVVTLPTATTGLLKLEVPAGAFTSTTGVPSQQHYGIAVLFAIPA